ncbi:hypothetical protein WJX72_003258 [[Myrmecia] bisecta]|uniref:Peptidase M48 domain-containing protein n=1 Tax=[Myrmecia] bisecta TaxID=41462 RepID=A0AAW1PJS8_9CHLO
MTTHCSWCQGVDWEFYVIDSPQVNAFVVPGGKVVCFTGLIKLMRNDDDLIAAVLGHEVAHILARHIAEKLTRGSFIFLAQFFLYTALGIPVPIELLQLTLFLPNSRKLEKEADIIGIHLAARACYDPAAAIVAQERMAAVVEGTLGKDSPALRWLSTHPLSKERIDALVQNLPKAQATYEESGCEQQKQDFWGSLPHAVPRIKRAAEWGWE